MAKILLFHFDSFFPAAHGSARYTQYLSKVLTEQGHCCRVALLAIHGANEGGRGQSITHIHHIKKRYSKNRVTFNVEGVEYILIDTSANKLISSQIWKILREDNYDIVFIGDESASFSEKALKYARNCLHSKVIYCVHTLHNLPFGQYAVKPSSSYNLAIRTTDKILTTSHFAQNYLKEKIKVPISVLYPQIDCKLFEIKTAPLLKSHITIINPCVWKGIDIFIELAHALPHLNFLAVSGWGTTDKDKKRLAALSNINLIPWQSDVEQVYCQTKILIVPSIWQENFGMVVLESLARGIPVLASDQGGLPEALLGTTSPIKVQPLLIDGFPPQIRVLPSPIESWVKALRGLIDDEKSYISACDHARRAANKFVQQNDWSRTNLLNIFI